MESQFKDTYGAWVDAPLQSDKIDADRIPAQNIDNPFFQTFIDVPTDLQSERHKAWKKYVVARNRLIDFYSFR